MKLEVEVSDCSDCPCAKGQYLSQYVICDHPDTLKSANITPFIAVKGVPAWCPLVERGSYSTDHTRDVRDASALGWYYPQDM